MIKELKLKKRIIKHKRKGVMERKKKEMKKSKLEVNNLSYINVFLIFNAYVTLFFI